METLQITRIRNDSNGNPRVVVHFLQLNTREELDNTGPEWVEIVDKYRLALNRARAIGGRKFHNRQYGGGIVFTCSPDELVERVNRVTGHQFTPAVD